MRKSKDPNPFLFSYDLDEFKKKKNRQKARKQGYWAMKWERKNSKRTAKEIFRGKDESSIQKKREKKRQK